MNLFSNLLKKDAFRFVMTTLLFGGALSETFAETFTMKDGTVLNGDLKGLIGDVYTVQTSYGLVKLPADKVLSITATGLTAGMGGTPQLVAPLRFAGSTTIGDELMPALIEAYAASHDETQIKWTIEGNASEQSFEASGPGGHMTAHLSRHGSATAFSALSDGSANVGMASRSINADEKAKLHATGFGVADATGQEHVLALDGLVVLVNRTNPVDRLTISDLAGVFSGRITNWSQIGGAPGPIHVLGRDAKSGSADTFAALVLKGAKVVGSAQLVDSSDALSDQVAADPSAIGFAGFAYVRRAKALKIIAECGLETPPIDFFVRTEEYPLSRRLYLYTRAPAAPEPTSTQAFVGFALGKAGQTEVARKGFVDLLPRLSAPDYSADRIAGALAQVARSDDDSSSDLRQIQAFNKIASNGRRLSVTFRFRTASFDLDTRGVRDIDRLVNALAEPEMSKRNLVVVGFSDAQGFPSRNITLAKARAERVATLLRGKGIVPKVVAGLGRVAPVACNSSPEGLEKNRRVEVWLDKR